MHTVGVLVHPGFQPLGLTVGSVFEYANVLRGEPFYRFHLFSEHGGTVPSSQGFAVDSLRLGALRCDTLFVAGDILCGEVAVHPAERVDCLREAAGQARRVAAISSGVFLLAQTGLLDGMRAAVHWCQAGAFRQRFAEVQVEADHLFATDGRFWTGAGMSAGLDLALAMVEADLGAELAREVARKLVVTERRRGAQPQVSALLEMDTRSDRIQAVLGYVREHLKEALTIDTLAGVARLSVRQFSRSFREATGQSPAKAIERLRVEAARVLIESGRHPVEIVARETGFGNRERMRQAFLREAGLPPQAIQRGMAMARA
ncbi:MULTISPECIES: helix-turn-helix domain-containing protein [unclassified Burkholderia]|uniref:GlxA family transcriptional regulator n=1 Tax=unclassified Burkholderia TaxID=2613784 RepID=UPI00046A476A|nr:MULTISPECIES: helix-turn-helix domain-containing protein [unclassified Burkholderia]NIF69381.1 helix-turn-helix domain-containing protein [Burkholderia sp. Ap-962]NIF86911.1 helix-turn-helix domain-containing protein [Burkholderia sp. Cy-637]